MINKDMLSLGQNRSAIRELFEQGKLLKEKYGNENVFDFSIGNPTAPCPKIINEKIKSLANNAGLNIHGYTSAAGDKNVREEIATYLNKTYDAAVSGYLIYLTVGAAAGLSIALKAVTSGNSDDEIIVFAPFFPEYSVFIKNANAKVVPVAPDYKTFYPNFDDFKNKITKNTSAVIINSPNNPTGVFYNKEILSKICDILSQKEKEFDHPIYLISDEPYREILFTDEKYSFITNLYNNSIVLYSFSKTTSIPGERVGYLVVNPNCENASDVYTAICGAGRSLGYVCATSLFQFIIPHCLGVTSDINIYKNNALFLYNELTKIGYEVVKPDGALYLFVKAPIDDDNEISKKALEYNLLLVPSESFGVKGYVRIVNCLTEEQTRNALPKFEALYNNYKS